MKIIFAGTPEFAVPALQALFHAGFQPVLVMTQPDRPAGRGMKLQQSPVKQLALQHNLSVFQPESLKPVEVQAQIAAANADVLIVAAYGLIIHASLLPRWRGAAPIHRALLANDAETGVTIMEVVPKLDAGNMISRGVVPISDTDTTQTLHDALSKMGADLMLQAMHDLAKNGHLMSMPQDENLVTYAHKLEKSESPIDWQKSAAEISRQVRGFNPFPVATAQFRGETCRIWFASAGAGTHKSARGEIIALESSIHAACGDGILMIHELQMPGGKRQTAQQFVQGQHV
jgi:methionyl-tRNA formyltransferase